MNDRPNSAAFRDALERVCSRKPRTAAEIDSDWDHARALLASAPIEAAQTSAAQWRKDGEPDPHGVRYDCERAALAMGNLTDDELANGAFLNYDRFDVSRLMAGDPTYHPPIVWMTAVKDRIRWLSRSLEKARAALASAPPAAATVPSKLDRFLGMVRVWVERDGGDMDAALAWMYSDKAPAAATVPSIPIVCEHCDEMGECTHAPACAARAALSTPTEGAAYPTDLDLLLDALGAMTDGDDRFDSAINEGPERDELQSMYEAVKQRRLQYLARATRRASTPTAHKAEPASVDETPNAYRARLAARCKRLAEWEPCDCGCESNKPKGAKDVALIQAAAALARPTPAAAAGVPPIEDRAALESACKFIEQKIAPRKCDSDGVSDCWRCKSVYLAKRMRDMLAASTPPGYVLVPREPTEEMWGELARDIIMWLQMTAGAHYGSKLHKHLRNLGREIPEWLAEEIPDADSSPSKGTIAVCIYKAMLAASPSAEAREQPTDLPLMSAAFRTTVTSGQEGLYEMRFRFGSLAALHAADQEWRSLLSAGVPQGAKQQSSVHSAAPQASRKQESLVHTAVSTSSVPDGVHRAESGENAPSAGGSAQ